MPPSHCSRIEKHPKKSSSNSKVLANPCGDYSFCDWTANTDCKDDYQGHFVAGKSYHCLDSYYLIYEKLGTDVLLLHRILPWKVQLPVLQVYLAKLCL
jgi:hypothetical protein